MNLNAMKQVAQKLGLTYDGELQYMPLAYGVLEGYTVVLYLDMLAARRNGRGRAGRIGKGGNAGAGIALSGMAESGSAEPLEYKFSVAVKMGEELPEYADFQQICKEAPCPMRATVRDYRVTFYLGGNERNWKEQAEQGIRDAERTTGNIADAVDGSKKAVSDAAGTAGRIASDGQRARIVIAECQQIIETVRRRGKVPAAQN